MSKFFLIRHLFADIQEHGIGVVNASPVSMGLLSHRGPPVWHPAGECVRLKCKEAADYCQVCKNRKGFTCTTAS